MKDKGRTFHPPRLTTTQRNALSAVDGMIIYNTTTAKYNLRQAGAWIELDSSAKLGIVQKTSDFTFNLHYNWNNDSQLAFNVEANSKYIAEYVMFIGRANSSTGSQALFVCFDGPASSTAYFSHYFTNVTEGYPYLMGYLFLENLVYTGSTTNAMNENRSLTVQRYSSELIRQLAKVIVTVHFSTGASAGTFTPRFHLYQDDSNWMTIKAKSYVLWKKVG